MKDRFKKILSNVTDQRTLYTWEQQIHNKSNRIEKSKDVWKYTLNQFKNAISQKLIIHDKVIREWSLKRVREIEFTSFVSSPTWIKKFKSYNKICSRKITKFVTQSFIQDEDTIIANSIEFVDSCIALFPNYSQSHIFNTDQSGFKYELHSGRTLSFQGTKCAEAVSQSIHSMTHSYTIQPIITLEGKLLSPLFICLQETHGKFDPNVKNSLISTPNVIVTCSQSGLMTKELVKQWFKDSLLPSVSEKFVLLLDSWKGQTDIDLYTQLLPNQIKCKVQIIPPKCTSLNQPLDAYFFRQWKIFVRFIGDKIIIDNLDVNIKDRNNIIKMHSLIQNQLSSPKFHKMIQYAWYKCGYLSEHPGKFQNFKEICFNSALTKCYLCEIFGFIICSCCKKSMCLTHFFINYHFCNELIE